MGRPKLDFHTGVGQGLPCRVGARLGQCLLLRSPRLGPRLGQRLILRGARLGPRLGPRPLLRCARLGAYGPRLGRGIRPLLRLALSLKLLVPRDGAGGRRVMIFLTCANIHLL